jgi:serine O-acetyltransferase
MIKETVSNIIKCYNSGNTIAKYPDKEVIRQIINGMRLILLPEYFSSVQDKRYLEHSLFTALEEVSAKLKSQLVFVIEGENDKAARQQAETVTEKFISAIPKIREYLLTDIDASFENDPAAYSKAEVVISYPGIFAVMVQRIAHELYLLGVPVISRMMTEHAHSITGIDIHPGAAIGKYFFLDHGTGVVIGETTVIGNNVKVYQGVTLGALSTHGGQQLKGVKRHPTIEDYVTIYSGASILGGDTVIGESVIIGSNAFITKSVPDKTRVSVKNPELRFKNGDSAQNVKIEHNQDEFWDYVI